MDESDTIGSPTTPLSTSHNATVEGAVVKMKEYVMNGEFESVKKVIDQLPIRCRKLLERQKKIMVDREKRKTLFHLACEYTVLQCADYLIQEGYCDVNEIDGYGNNGLHYICQASSSELIHVEMTKNLVQWGINFNRKNVRNESPLELCMSRGICPFPKCQFCGHDRIADLLLRQEGIVVDGLVLYYSVVHKHAATVRKLVDMVDLDDEYMFGAIRSVSDVQICRILLKKVNLQSRDVKDRTPLHIATMNGRELIIQEMLALNADPNAKDEHGRTCLHYAAIHMNLINLRTVNWIKIFRMLLDAGATLSHVDLKKEWTVMDYLKKSKLWKIGGHVEMQNVLNLISTVEEERLLTNSNIFTPIKRL